MIPDIPDISDIFQMLANGQCSFDQAEAWVNTHLELAESRVTFNAPALDRIAAALERMEAGDA